MKKENKKKIFLISIICVILFVFGFLICLKSKTINSYLIKEEDKTHDVKYELIEETEDDRYVNIYYKDNIIKKVELGPVRDILDVYQLGDIIIYSIINSDATRTVQIIDQKGNIIKDYHDFDEGMNLVSEDYIEVSDGTIIFNAGQYSFSCDNEDYKDVNLVEAKYELNYLGKNKFSELKMISNTTKEDKCIK